MRARIPPRVQGAYIAAVVTAALVGCCALYSGVGVAASYFIQQQAAALGSLDGGGGTPELAGILELQRSLAIITFALMLLQLLTSGALAVGGGLGLGRRSVGRMVTLVAWGLFATTTLAEVAVGVWSWTQTTGLMSAGTQGGGMESGYVGMFSAAAMLPSVCWWLFKFGVAFAGVTILLSTESREYHAQLGGEDAHIGPRG